MNVLSLPQPTPTLCVTRQPCERCGGTGNELLAMFRRCSECSGSGHGRMVQWIVPLDQPAPPEAIGTHIALAADETEPGEHDFPDWFVDDGLLAHKSNGPIIALPRNAIVGSATIQTCLPIYASLPFYNVSDQLPYGDYRPGRYAWILTDAAPCTERCPLCGGTGYDPTGDDIDCPVCPDLDRYSMSIGRCEPIPWTPPNPQQLTQWTPT